MLFSDSNEAGPLNWTDGMFVEFRNLRGYDVHPFLPAIAGVIVDSPQATNKFLWNFRQTIAELTADGTYKTISDVAREHGMKAMVQALETNRL